MLLLFGSILGETIPAEKCGMGHLDHVMGKRSDTQSRDLDFLDESYVSESGQFRIHYTRSGSHAVLGSGDTGVPSFVLETAIAADSVYGIIVGDLGFLPPPDDGQIDGPEHDIYIKNWYGAYYGMTYFDQYQASSVFPGYPSYLVVDNDYVEANYATKGLEALRVTIAHEFFHMVQLAYAHPGEFDWENLNWYEISSVWMEEICYPDINDYFAYVEDNFRQLHFPGIDGSSAYSYGHGIFAQVLDLEYGEANGKHIMLDLWEHLEGRNAFSNINTVLSSSPWNSSMTEALGKYALYNVFTGTRSIPGQYYPDAADLPEIRLSAYDLPLDISGPPYDFELSPLQTTYKKFTVPSLSDFLVKGVDLSPNQRVYITSFKAQEAPALKGALSSYWIPCEQMYSSDYLILPMANGNLSEGKSFSIVFEGSLVDLEPMIQALWPNPLRPEDKIIHLNMILSEFGPLVLTVFNLKGQQIHRTYTSNPVEGVFELDLPLPSELGSGIYFLQVRSGKARMTTKFTVLK
jgi:hypothetical protein